MRKVFVYSCLTILILVPTLLGCSSPPPSQQTPPTADFGGVPTSGAAPLAVAFTDQSTNGSAAITQWDWDFGDGRTGSGANPTHAYMSAGEYTVTLTVTSPDGSDSEEKPGYIEVTQPVMPTVTPASGAPGTMVKITIPGNALDVDEPVNDVTFFGDKAMPPANVTNEELTTAVPPLAAAGVVQLRVEVNGVTIADGLTFEILPPVELTDPPGTVAAGVRNTMADVVATTLNAIKPAIDALATAEGDELRAALDAFDQQSSALQPLMDYVREHDELELMDQVFVSSGFADALQGTDKELKKRLALAEKMDALEKALQGDGPVKAGQDRFLPARTRFILDWLASRLHLAMEFANVAMTALNTAATFSPATGLYTFGGAVAIANVFMAQLNLVVLYVEACPVELIPDSLTGQVGKDNVVATNSWARAVFMGDFKSEKNSDQVAWGLFFGPLAEHLGLPSILISVFDKIGDRLLETAEHPEEHTYIIPPLPPDPDMPIYAFEFVQGLTNNPPEFDGAGVATLNIPESKIEAGDEEGGPFDLIARQKVYRFKGGFFAPGDPPHIEKEDAECTVPVTVKRGLILTLGEPVLQDPPPPLGDPMTATISGHVENWDGSPVNDRDVTITIEVIGTTVTITPTGGDFTEDVTVPPGTTTVTVTGDDGKTTATQTAIVLNVALPATYCVVTNVSGDSLSLIDPTLNMEFQRVASSDVDGVLDGPRDAAFLPDGETLLVLNSAAGTVPNVVALRMPNLAAIEAISAPLTLSAGKSWAMALAPDGKTALVTCMDTASALHVIDVRQPDALRLIDTIDLGTYDSYGTANVCTASTSDGRSIALVTMGNYQSGGPGLVVVLDITNPYNVSVTGTVDVASRGGAIAVVPGEPLAVISGTTYYNTGTQKVDGAIDVVDFSDPEAPVARGTLAQPGAFLFGLAIVPDGGTAIVTDVGNPLAPSNRLLQFDVTDPDSITPRVTGSPLAFDGTGAARLRLSPDGRYGITTNNVSDGVVAFNLHDLTAPVANDAIDVGDLPYGVAFRPALP